MAILKGFDFQSILDGPFADYLNVTVPYGRGEELRNSLLPLLDDLGAHEEGSEGIFQFFSIRARGSQVSQYPDGVLKLKRRGQVLVISASGGVLRRMRDRGLYGDYLSILGAFPHRVSMLHATADYLSQSPPESVLSVKAAAMAGELALTRKKLQPGQCRYLLGTDAQGNETGTAYLGQRSNADVWAKIYDKRHERVCAGFPDPGPIVRVEIAIHSDVGASLRDAMDPRDIFFHFAGRTLVAAPPDFSGWESHAEGYSLEPRPEKSLFWRLEGMFDHPFLGRLGSMAMMVHQEQAAAVIGRRVVKAGEKLDKLLASREHSSLETTQTGANDGSKAANC